MSPKAPRLLVLTPQQRALECPDVRGHILKQLLLASNDDPREVCTRVLRWSGVARGWGGDVYRLGCEALRVDTEAWKMADYKTLFVHVCGTLRQYLATRLGPHTLHAEDHWAAYAALGWWYREEMRTSASALRYVPRDRPDYADIAAAATVSLFRATIACERAGAQLKGHVQFRMPGDFYFQELEDAPTLFQAIVTLEDDGTSHEGSVRILEDWQQMKFLESPSVMTQRDPLFVSRDLLSNNQLRGVFLFGEIVENRPHPRWSEIPPAWA